MELSGWPFFVVQRRSGARQNKKQRKLSPFSSPSPRHVRFAADRTNAHAAVKPDIPPPRITTFLGAKDMPGTVLYTCTVSTSLF